MSDRRFVAEQWIPRARQEVFAFFSVPENLERITPPWLRFRLVARSTPQIGEGTELTYRLRIHGIPVTWRSRIERWDPDRSFVDVQLRGPYARWHHTHTFEERDGGTLIGDDVSYRLPFPPLGPWLAGPFVDRDVRRIFEFRRRAIEEIFR